MSEHLGPTSGFSEGGSIYHGQGVREETLVEILFSNLGMEITFGLKFLGPSADGDEHPYFLGRERHLDSLDGRY